MLLAIDTSAGTAVAVVDRDGGILAERSVADTRRHAELIGPLIAEVLAAAGCAPAALSGVAVGMGPGPFTGLRVGIAAARAFAAGIGRPTLPLVSHDAVAYAAARAGETRPLVVVTDARRREIAWSAYAAPDELGLPVRFAGPTLAAVTDSIQPFSVLPGSVVQPGFEDDLARTAEEDGEGERIDASEIPAGALGLLAEALYANGRPFGPAEPIYLRPPDVTVSTPKRVTG